jgi:hypothetical protein
MAESRQGKMAFHDVAGSLFASQELNCTAPVSIGLIRINALGTKSSLQFERRLLFSVILI